MKKLFLFLMTAVTVILCSCESESATMSMRVFLQDSVSSRTLTPVSVSSDAVKYTVSGNGPGGKTFTVESSNSTLSIDGLAVGQWTIDAVGYNKSGKSVSTGHKTFTLDKDSNSVTVNLERVYGTGSLSVQFDWDGIITEPYLAFTLTGPGLDGEEKTKVFSPGSGKTQFTVELDDLESGCYLMKVILSNGNTEVAGTVEAVKIVNGEVTSGTVSMVLASDNSGESSEPSVVTPTGNVFSCRFEGTSDEVVSGEEISVFLVLDGTFDSSFDYVVRWYLDGNEIAEQQELALSGNSIKFKPASGVHILSAVIYSMQEDSVGSVVWKFTAKADSKPGAAQENSVVTSESAPDVALSSSSIVSALPDGKFLIVTPDAGVLQICTVVSGKMILLNTCGRVTEGFSWLGDTTAVNSIQSSRVFTVVDAGKNLNLLSINKTSNAVSRVVFLDQPVRVTEETPLHTKTYTDILLAKVTADEEETVSIITADRNSQNMFVIKSSPSSVIKFGLTYMGAYSDMTDFDRSGTAVGFVVDSTSSVGFSEFDGYILKETPVFPSFSKGKPFRVCMINSDNAIVFGTTGFSRFTRTYGLNWSEAESVDIPMQDVTVSSDGKYFYTIDYEGNVYSYSTIWGQIVNIGKIETKINLKSICLSGKDIAVMTEAGSLILYEVAQEEK